MFAFPSCGGLTFKILQASSKVRPDEEAPSDASLPPCFAYCCDADACLHASVKARPTTRVPTRTICVMMRCALRTLCQLKVHMRLGKTVPCRTFRLPKQNYESSIIDILRYEFGAFRSQRNIASTFFHLGSSGHFSPAIPVEGSEDRTTLPKRALHPACHM